MDNPNLTNEQIQQAFQSALDALAGRTGSKSSDKLIALIPLFLSIDWSQVGYFKLTWESIDPDDNGDGVIVPRIVIKAK
jgi:hypothetical protein